MSAKPETKFRNWFIQKLREYVLAKGPTATFRAQKHADYATAGVPDVDISINGITMWLEFKLIPQCAKERKLDVTELQRVELSSIADACVRSGVLVGLPLGPRQGYEVAYLDEPIPATIKRADFGPVEAICSVLYSQAYVSAESAHNRFKYISLSRLPLETARP